MPFEIGSDIDTGCFEHWLTIFQRKIGLSGFRIIIVVLLNRSGGHFQIKHKKIMQISRHNYIFILGQMSYGMDITAMWNLKDRIKFIEIKLKFSIFVDSGFIPFALNTFLDWRQKD